MELDIASFALGFVVGTGILCFGFLLGKIEQGFKITEIFKKPERMLPEDIPGTDEYYEKALRRPGEGGHSEVADPFEQELIDLHRHSL